ncbi:HNH endonuclease [Halorussus marinus]|uniref:HNH endonuclease n=1 Tax=Halorussus marinus TaxID=2505976 RepID=UPI00143104B3|nr:HNH endonuclease [Halorussus marinus]
MALLISPDDRHHGVLNVSQSILDSSALFTSINMRLENVDITTGETLNQSDFKEVFGQGATGKGIEIRYDDKGQKYLWLFAKETGRYDDNIGTDKFRYTGEDPQGPGVENPGQEDQELKRGNAALREALNTPVPIFLFYQPAGRDGWEYRGMVNVVSFEYKPRNGRYIYEFTLEPIKNKSETPLDIDGQEHTPDIHQPPQTSISVSRIIRNTQLTKEIKEKYDYNCQICGETRRGNNGDPYAEAHHVQPLGKPHNGPDEESNILVLCPNHHADFDYGRAKIDTQTYEVEHADRSEIDGTELSIAPGHDLEGKYIRYHNAGIAQF